MMTTSVARFALSAVVVLAPGARLVAQTAGMSRKRPLRDKSDKAVPSAMAPETAAVPVS